MGSSKKQTVGYKYYMGLHFGLCHGPVDALHQVKVGDRCAWLGTQSTNGALSIDAPNLFGGKKKEGGVQGTLDICMGGPSQTANDYLAAKIGTPMPAFRGILSAVWRGGLVTANNPYVKPWSFRVRRILQGWTGGEAWYPEQAEIPNITVNGEHAVFFAIDASGSQAEAIAEGVTRWDVVRDALITVLQDLQTTSDCGGKLHVGYAPFSWQVYSGDHNGTSVPVGTYLRHYPNATRADLDDLIDVVTHTPLLFGTSFDTGLLAAQDFFASLSLSGCSRKTVVFITDGECWQLSTDPATTTWDAADGYDYKEMPGYISQPCSYTQSGGGTVGYGATEAAAIAAELWADGVDVYAYNTTSSSTYTAMLSNTGTPTQLDGTNTAAVLNGIRAAVSGGTADMNPAHILYQCLTDTAWGMGYPTSAIDDAAFTAAADALYAEQFGLSMIWNRQDTLESFIGIILDHIGGILYVDPATGKFALKLIRDDYDPGTLPQFGPDDLISATDYQRQSWGETINEITVVYTSPCAGKSASITVHDLANIQSQGAVVAQTREYPGICRAELAQRVAMRDLLAASTPLAKIKLTATRAAWTLIPGDVFRLSWPDYGLSNVVFRALEVNRGTLADGQIVIDAVEDIFALPDNTYVVAQPGEWADSVTAPVAADAVLVEAPYWDLVRGLSAADLDYVDPLSGYLEVLAHKPSDDSLNYELWTRTGSADYAERGDGDFCPSALVVGALAKEESSTVTLSAGIDLDLVAVGSYAVIGGEYVAVTAIDADAGTATLARGVLDTVPAAHAAGARILFADGFQGLDETEYADGETVDAKLLTRTGLGELSLTAAPAESLTMANRSIRPYPPGQFTINGNAYPVRDSLGDLVIAWAHRDRLLQTAYLVDQSEGDIGPEAGTTYSIEVLDSLGATLYTATGITGTSHTVPESSLISDRLTLRLWSVRDGYDSFQAHAYVLEYGILVYDFSLSSPYTPPAYSGLVFDTWSI